MKYPRPALKTKYRPLNPQADRSYSQDFQRIQTLMGVRLKPGADLQSIINSYSLSATRDPVTLFLTDGVYEYYGDSLVVAPSRLRIYGPGAILRRLKTGRATPFVQITGSDVLFEGIRIEDPYANGLGAHQVYVTGDQVTLSHLRIPASATAAQHGDGIHVADGADYVAADHCWVDVAVPARPNAEIWWADLALTGIITRNKAPTGRISYKGPSGTASAANQPAPIVRP